jgi:hypothetical protein
VVGLRGMSLERASWAELESVVVDAVGKGVSRVSEPSGLRLILSNFKGSMEDIWSAMYFVCAYERRHVRRERE